MKTHEIHKPKHYCEVCDIDFRRKVELDTHNIKKHGSCQIPNEWNCNNCPFQANSADDLMKHLKTTAHQPSPEIKNKKKLFCDYKQCYTCKLEFNGYWNLMEHRKIMHPSNKKCRNYPGGKCSFGSECWYVHEEQLMDVDESFESPVEDIKFKCNVCASELENKDSLMKHKKTSHIQNVPVCEKFSKSFCQRSDSQCWYKHIQVEEIRQPQHQMRDENPNRSRKDLLLSSRFFRRFRRIHHQIF